MDDRSRLMEQAARSRRLAGGIGDHSVIRSLKEYAAELELRAAAISRYRTAEAPREA